MIDEALASLSEKYFNADQGQVFAFYDSLDHLEQKQLYKRLASLCPHHINKLAERALNFQAQADADSAEPATPSTVAPLPAEASASVLETEESQLQAWYDSGLKAIAEGKVAVVLMAGGQGTRLGSSAPKGCFDIGLPSGKTLFQLQAERIAKLQILASEKFGKEKVVIPWYIMTSEPTHKPTTKFFEEHDYFQLDKENVVFFEQGILPCISNEGKILMESKSKVAVAPDGNGGIYNALVKSGVRDDMHKRGIEHVHAYCVDNCLVKVADPTFIGFSASKNVEIATKVVRKRSSAEPVGLIVAKDDRPAVVEYSEIDRALTEAPDPERPGVLKYRSANIVNHYYSIGFLDKIEEYLPRLEHHVARKKIPHVNTATGETIKPEKPNGIKLEQFIFDVFPLIPMDKFASLEVRREEEFSPLKNARGACEDDPDTSRDDIMRQGARWLKAAGVKAGETAEVSPLLSYGGEINPVLKGTTVREGEYLWLKRK